MHILISLILQGHICAATLKAQELIATAHCSYEQQNVDIRFNEIIFREGGGRMCELEHFSWFDYRVWRSLHPSNGP